MEIIPGNLHDFQFLEEESQYTANDRIGWTSCVMFSGIHHADVVSRPRNI